MFWVKDRGKTPIVWAVGDVPLFCCKFLIGTESSGADFLSGVRFLGSNFQNEGEFWDEK